MVKYLSVGMILSLFLLLITGVSAQYYPAATLNASLDSYTPPSQTLLAGVQQIDLVRIKLAASGYDVFLNGIEVGTDVEGGLSNFLDIKVYDVYGTGSGPVLKGTVPNQSSNPYLIQFGNAAIIPNGQSKTYLIRASLSSSAAGNIRIGFKDLIFSTSETPTLENMPIYGNVMTLPGMPTPTPIPVSTSSPQTTPAPILMGQSTPASLGFTSLSAINLQEGNTISAIGLSDPDIYIVNDWGYKRLFLNPVIFGFYGHLGGFASVKTIVSSTRDMLVTSGLVRNCETNDPKVYGIETTGEDTGMLHWVNTSGEQAALDDPDFFKKVFCINSNEFNWYSQGSVYTSVNQIPAYSR